MTPDRFSAALALLHWTPATVARASAVSERTVWRWANGEYAVPPRIEAWLETLADFHAAHPAPEREQR